GSADGFKVVLEVEGASQAPLKGRGDPGTYVFVRSLGVARNIDFDAAVYPRGPISIWDSKGERFLGRETGVRPAQFLYAYDKRARQVGRILLPHAAQQFGWLDDDRVWSWDKIGLAVGSLTSGQAAYIA